MQSALGNSAVCIVISVTLARCSLALNWRFEMLASGQTRHSSALSFMLTVLLTPTKVQAGLLLRSDLIVNLVTLSEFGLTDSMSADLDDITDMSRSLPTHGRCL